MKSKNHSQSRLTLSCTLSPVKDLAYNLSNLLGNFNSELVNNFLPKIIGKRLNIIISELVNNVYENITDEDSSFNLTVKIDPEKAVVAVKNKVSMKQYETVKNQIARIRKSKNPNELLSETIKERRNKNLRGGLGLIRLTSEVKSDLSVRYRKTGSMMTIISKLSIEDDEL